MINSKVVLRGRGAAGALTGAAVLVVNSCGGPGPTLPDPSPAEPMAVTMEVSPRELVFASIGEQVQLTVIVRDQYGEEMPGAALGWTSTVPDVVSVTPDGLVTSVAPGRTMIIVSAGSVAAVTGGATVTVTQELATVALVPAEMTIAVGDTVMLAFEGRDARGNLVADELLPEISWISGNSDMARVWGTQNAGRVTGESKGTVAVTASVPSQDEMAATAMVTVEQTLAYLVVAPPSVTVSIGDSATLSVEGRDRRNAPIPVEELGDVTWESGDETVATLADFQQTATVTALSEGDATITAKIGNVTGFSKVEVPPDPAVTPCEGGMAGLYPCQGLNLVSNVPPHLLRPGKPSQPVNDIWGWTDPVTGTEYALIGRQDGLSIVDLSEPLEPTVIAFLPSAVPYPSLWRDMKVYADHVYVVADNASGHGVQILDLTRLRDLEEYTELDTDGRYTGVGSVHNIVINEETGFAYAVGSGTCGGGMHALDLDSPTAPVFAGCIQISGTGLSGSGYTHDAQCVVYLGPDAEYQGREICIGLNENRLVVVDATDKSDPLHIATGMYPDFGYLHQGWFDEEHRFFYMNDELDEGSISSHTRLIVWDLIDLDDPVVSMKYLGPTTAIDHNAYVLGDRLYQSNYEDGIRVLDISVPGQPQEGAFFDTSPSGLTWNGSWSNYPFFQSKYLIVSSWDEGLFVLRLDEDGDG